MKIELKLVDTGWNRHFKKPNHDHWDIGKFQTLDSKKTFLVMFSLPKGFDTKTLKKKTVFTIGLAPSGNNIMPIAKGVELYIHKKKDLDIYPM